MYLSITKRTSNKTTKNTDNPRDDFEVDHPLSSKLANNVFDEKEESKPQVQKKFDQDAT